MRDLKEAPDLAILAVRADMVLNTLRECGESGVKFAIVFTSGFGETGEEGRAAEAEMRAIVAQTGMRIYGPNCPGLNNMNARLGMTFSPRGASTTASPAPSASPRRAAASGVPSSSRWTAASASGRVVLGRQRGRPRGQRLHPLHGGCA
ncbi:CoA-binding protein [Cupriavidus basilensis]